MNTFKQNVLHNDSCFIYILYFSFQIAFNRKEERFSNSFSWLDREALMDFHRKHNGKLITHDIKLGAKFGKDDSGCLQRDGNYFVKNGLFPVCLGTSWTNCRLQKPLGMFEYVIGLVSCQSFYRHASIIHRNHNEKMHRVVSRLSGS